MAISVFSLEIVCIVGIGYNHILISQLIIEAEKELGRREIGKVKAF